MKGTCGVDTWGKRLEGRTWRRRKQRRYKTEVKQLIIDNIIMSEIIEEETDLRGDDKD